MTEGKKYVTLLSEHMFMKVSGNAANLESMQFNCATQYVDNMVRVRLWLWLRVRV